jgi:hypothetical protein
MTTADTERVVQESIHTFRMAKRNNLINNSPKSFDRHKQQQKRQNSRSTKVTINVEADQHTSIQYINKKQQRQNRVLMGMMNSTKSSKKNGCRGKGKGKHYNDDDDDDQSSKNNDQNDSNKSPKGQKNVDKNENEDIIDVPLQNDRHSDSTGSNNNDNGDGHNTDPNDNESDSNNDNSLNDSGDQDGNNGNNNSSNVDNTNGSIGDSPIKNDGPQNPQEGPNDNNGKIDDETNDADPVMMTVSRTIPLQSFVISVAVSANYSSDAVGTDTSSASSINTNIPISEEQLRIGLLQYMSNTMMIYYASNDTTYTSSNDDDNVGRHGINTLTNYLISTSTSNNDLDDVHTKSYATKQDIVDNKLSTSASYLLLHGSYLGSSVVYSTGPYYNDSSTNSLDISTLVSTIWYKYNYTGNLTLTKQIHQDNNDNSNNTSADQLDDDTTVWQMKQRYSLSEINTLKMFLNRYLFVYYGNTTRRNNYDQQGRNLEEQDESTEESVTILTDVSIRFSDGQVYGNVNTGIDVTTDSTNEQQGNGIATDDMTQDNYKNANGDGSNVNTYDNVTNVNIIDSNSKQQYDPVLIGVMTFVGCGSLISVSFLMYRSCVENQEQEQEELTRGSFLGTLHTTTEISRNQHPPPTTNSLFSFFDWTPSKSRQQQQYQQLSFQSSSADELPLLRNRRSSNDSEIVLYTIDNNGIPHLESYNSVRRNSFVLSSASSSTPASTTIINASPSGTIIATTTSTTGNSVASKSCFFNVYCHQNDCSDNNSNVSIDKSTTCTIIKRNEVLVQPNLYNYSSDECEEFALQHFLPDINDCDDDVVDFDNIQNITKITANSSTNDSGTSTPNSEMSRMKLFLLATKALESMYPNQSTIIFTQNILQEKQRKEQQRNEQQHTGCRLSFRRRRQQQRKQFALPFSVAPTPTKDNYDDNIIGISYHSPTLDTESLQTPTEIEFNGDEFDDYFEDENNYENNNVMSKYNADEKLTIIGLDTTDKENSNSRTNNQWYRTIFSSSSSSSNNTSGRSIVSATSPSEFISTLFKSGRFSD